MAGRKLRRGGLPLDKDWDYMTPFLGYSNGYSTSIVESSPISCPVNQDAERLMWSAINGLVDEIKICEKAGATTAAIAMAYVCIDTMAYLSLPDGREKHRNTDFIGWVNAYLIGHEDQPYQYRGLDVYGARCAMLHAFGSDSEFHDKYQDVRKFGYRDGGKHAYDPTVDERLVIIGTASFLNDVVRAVSVFLERCKEDADLRGRVEGRLPKVLATFPVSA